MQTINLKQYYPFCTEDTFVEVSDEIVEAFLLDKRAEAARERKMYRYKAFYSLDCDDGIENAAIGWAQPSPEDCLMEKEAQAEYAELIRRLYEAISSLTPTQARRVHARYKSLVYKGARHRCRCRAPCRGLLRTSSAMGSYTPQTPCAPQATEHPQAAVPSPAA